MTDLTPALNTLLSAKNAPSITSTTNSSPADEFLKEAHRIVRHIPPPPTHSTLADTHCEQLQNSHIASLLKYLTSIRHAYLSTNTPSRRNQAHSQAQPQSQPQSNLTDPERDAIDTSTTTLLQDLSSSITNLSDAETLRQKTTLQLQHKKYGHSAAGALLLRWAANDRNGDSSSSKSAEQIEAEEREKTLSSLRESVLWFLRRGLEGVASVQRGMVEKRIERVLEREKSVLYKSSGSRGVVSDLQGGSGSGAGGRRDNHKHDYSSSYGAGSAATAPAPDAAVLSEADSKEIEGQLSAEQLQLFAEENDSMLKHYEDTLGKVQNAERSLVEISSLQETLVTHLTTQGEYISQLVSDVDLTEENIGRGNRELKRATERKSTAQAVFWGTVGLCTWLVVWDLIF
ncbi:unnamed protein product [Penicillium pancosmium]